MEQTTDEGCFIEKRRLFDGYTIRGLIYGLISLAGLGYELSFVKEARPFLLIMYSIVIVFSLYCIFYLKDSDGDTSQ